MSYDGVATAAAVSELQQNLTLGKIEKIISAIIPSN